ncbi:MAG TPA: 23S rRNA (guanosine(2251)-2'-O)-methyltransferase RlmB [Elusimicrobiales bacterium]|nr:23S rRNA (guanosine(2251)-2'-O)-methyltransferase RlmB [Elusimicrobiales bacterium]
MSDLDFIYGAHSAIETLKAGKRKILQLLVENRKRNPAVDKVILLARQRGITVVKTEPGVLDKLCAGGNHQGVLLKAEPLSLLRLNQAVELAKNDKNAVWLAVDEITDPQNLGSIIRSAVCLGASAILLPERRTAGISPAVHKAASGAVEKARLVPVANLTNALLTLKEAGFWIYGADMAGAPVGKAQLNKPLVLVIGSEGAGLRRKTVEHCDGLVSIPQAGTGVQSLNAACACAILLYAIQQRPG